MKRKVNYGRKFGSTFEHSPCIDVVSRLDKPALFINHHATLQIALESMTSSGWGAQGGVNFSKHTVVQNCDSEMSSQPVHEQYVSISPLQ